MNTNPNDSAFGIPENEYNKVEWGLSKREYFAAMAMQGLLANGHPNVSSFETNIEFSVKYADALMAELNKTNS